MGECFILRQEQSSVHISDVNCVPLSEVKTAGTPKLDIQLWSRAFTQSVVLVAERGMASDHLVDQSMTVRRCVYPFDDRSRPTRST